MRERSGWPSVIERASERKERRTTSLRQSRQEIAVAMNFEERTRRLLQPTGMAARCSKLRPSYFYNTSRRVLAV